MKTVAAGNFKAHCLALLDEVADRGETIIVTKRGTPVAKIMPPTKNFESKPLNNLKGSVLKSKDLISPIPFKWMPR